ncbi:hypothetical protein [Parafrankia sp. BMG5.11]|nr:hypothetical protein [Parafrankia sp. BMG5.11]
MSGTSCKADPLAAQTRLPFRKSYPARLGSPAAYGGIDHEQCLPWLM